jgi:PilZ domain
LLVEGRSVATYSLLYLCSRLPGALLFRRRSTVAMRDTSSPSAEISVDAGTGYPRRSDLRYSFVAKIEVTDSSGKQIVAVTSNLSRYGCHVPTTTPFLPGTSVKLRIKRDRTTFESEGKVVYALSGSGMGIHFGNVPVGERVVLKEWLVQVSAAELEQRLRQSREANPSTPQKIIVLSALIVVLVATLALTLLWFGLP